MKKLCAVIAIMGLLMVIGSAGSLDLDRISFGQCVLQSIGGLLLLGIGVGGAINA